MADTGSSRAAVTYAAAAFVAGASLAAGAVAYALRGSQSSALPAAAKPSSTHTHARAYTHTDAGATPGRSASTAETKDVAALQAEVTALQREVAAQRGRRIAAERSLREYINRDVLGAPTVHRLTQPGPHTGTHTGTQAGTPPGVTQGQGLAVAGAVGHTGVATEGPVGGGGGTAGEGTHAVAVKGHTGSSGVADVGAEGVPASITGEAARITQFPCTVIGYIESPFRRRSGTPRQGLLAPDSRARLVLARPRARNAAAPHTSSTGVEIHVPPDSLDGLDAYSHAFVVFVFHENSDLHKRVIRPGKKNRAEDDDEAETAIAAYASPTFGARSRTYLAKIRPPGLGGKKTGVFSTRTPHRPNAIGLSLVRVIRVDTRLGIVELAGADLVDGTPVLDIKPVNPADCGECLWRSMKSALMPSPGVPADAIDVLRCGVASDAAELLRLRSGGFTHRFPSWVHDSCFDSRNRVPVLFADDCRAEIIRACNAKQCQFYGRGEADTMMQAIAQVLSLDIRDVRHGRGTRATPRAHEVDAQRYEIYYDNLHVEFFYEDLPGGPSNDAGGVSVDEHDHALRVPSNAKARILVRTVTYRPLGEAIADAAMAGDVPTEASAVVEEAAEH